MIIPQEWIQDLRPVVIEHGTKLYDQSLALRFSILRKPLGMVFSPQTFEMEAADIHLGIVSKDWLVGCLILTSSAENKAKMRQVAVHKSWQGKGVGKKLVRFAEEYALQNGISHFYLNARETAIPFYLSMNYVVLGERFEEVGIPHFQMEKNLRG